MALFLLVLVVCLAIFGSMIALLMLSGTPRYRTEPNHLLELFDKALESRVGETEWNAIIGYPIRHDDYLDGIRRRAQRLMDEHGRHARVTRGKPLLDAIGQEELAALRDHLAAHTSLAEGKQNE
ncbi:hypothetical protein [Halomonas daqiaonensis]|uniref:Uncharacterized protein n=1 Tax=Halomonas daqiaonensis TaxID=650850 RepID=A0A1H7ULL3_9GAMM|nr:hypothetical protein [Halomonas daqiaonensis]SEL97831.1 hypothetical protein SAMN04488129_12114 [Halomonas daqiaonensis]